MPPRPEARRFGLPLEDPWPFVVAVWVASRVFFFTVGAIGNAYVRFADPGGFPREPPGFLNYWAHWDGGWYAAIAERGYFSRASTSFFPLYPLLVRLFDYLPGGTAYWGVVVSTACLLAALYFFYEIAEELFDAETARASTLVFAFFPSAFFMNAVFSESVFLATTTGAIWALRVKRHFLLACAFACFATAARNVGVFLLVPLVYALVRRRPVRIREGVLALVGSVGGLAAYMVYLWQVRGDPLYFAVAQRETWGRALTNPVHTMEKAWTTAIFGARYAFHPMTMFGNSGVEQAFKASDTFNLFFFGLLLVLVVIGASKLPIDLWAYSVLVILAPILTPSPLWALTSFNRYLLACFPLFFVLGWLFARNRFVLGIWVVASAALGVYLTLLFVTWRWVA
jgi:Dolichyl-phosphate-mannose-protein mannosyltransferase